MIPARALPTHETRDKRIRIESPGTTRDALGELVPGWTHFATVWAWMEDASGREYVAAGATQDSTLTRIVIDYLPGVVAKMRIVHGADTYNIENVLGQDRRKLELMCKRLA